VDRLVAASYSILQGPRRLGFVTVTAEVPGDVAEKKAIIGTWARQSRENHDNARSVRRVSVMLMTLITLFVLFVATWIALFLSKQISIPITALAEAASQVRAGNLSHRVNVRAADELGSLVRGFNQMTQELEPTAASSTGAAASLRPSSKAFPPASSPSTPTASSGSSTAPSTNLSGYPGGTGGSPGRPVFARGHGRNQVPHEARPPHRRRLAPIGAAHGKPQPHLSVTVAALEEKVTSGFVIVIEDSSELLRAQKAAAWHEVARRVAHESRIRSPPSRCPPNAYCGKSTAWRWLPRRAHPR